MAMYKLTMWTICGQSGVFFNSSNDAIKFMQDGISWYYAKIEDENGITIIEERRPYYVPNCPMVDNYTGETFFTGKCFGNYESAVAAQHSAGTISYLTDKMDYLDL